MFCIFILVVTRKKKLSYKYTFLWLIFGCITMLCAAFPSIVINLSKLIYIKEPTNALFLIYIFMMIVIIFYISCAFSKMNEKIIKLIQQNALLEHRLEEISKKVSNDKENNDGNN